MLEALLTAARFLHYACLTALFGVLLFPAYAARAPGGVPAAWRTRVGDASLPALAGALVSGVLWFLTQAGAMTGDINAAGDPAALWLVASTTGFGILWGVRLILLVLTAAAMVRPVPRLGRVGPMILSGLLLASLAWTGHAQSQDGLAHLIHEGADVLHLLAAGAWLGGLVMLGFVLQRTDYREDPALGATLSGFSTMGQAAVAVLLLTGVVNSLFQISAPAEFLLTAYGRLLGLKILLFLAMVGLAAVNRLWITPALARGSGDAGPWIARLKRHVLAEQVLGAAVLLAVAALGVMEPGA